MINNVSVANTQTLSSTYFYNGTDQTTDQLGTDIAAPISETVNISGQAQQLFSLEQGTGFAPLSTQEQARVDKINAEIDKIFATEQVPFSKADKKTADQLYKQIDNIFADNKVTKEEEKQLAKLDNKLTDIYQKYEKPLSQEQEKKLESLFAELDQIYGIEAEPVDDLFQGLGLSEAEQKQADKLNAEIDKILGNDLTLSEQDTLIADKLYEQIDALFVDGQINADEEKQLAELDAKLSEIYQKYEKPLTKEDEQKLDQLFGQLDKLYGLS